MKMIIPCLALVFFLLCAGSVFGKEYAIIKDTLFGSQKIEIYQSLEEALKNYTGDGTLYEISRKRVPVKRIETKKKIEVTEYQWIVEEGAKKQ